MRFEVKWRPRRVLVAPQRLRQASHDVQGDGARQVPHGREAIRQRTAVRLLPGLSFSWRRAVGLSALKARLSRRLGVPLTASGRERKVGRGIMRAAFGRK